MTSYRKSCSSLSHKTKKSQVSVSFSMEIEISKKLLQSLVVIVGSSASPSNTCTSKKNIKGGQKEKKRREKHMHQGLHSLASNIKASYHMYVISLKLSR